MQLLVVLPVLVALFNYNGASVIQNSKSEILNSSTSSQGYPFHHSLHQNVSGIEFTSRIEGGQSRMIGGKKSRSKDTPWIAAIFYDNDFHCTGSLINTYWVLTAAHCLVQQKSGCKYEKMKERDFEVSIGDVDLRIKKTIDVDDVEVHKYYNPCSSNYDIGLMKLERKQSSFRIICLDTSRGPLGRQYGFGQTSSSISSAGRYLKHVYIKVVSSSDCEKDWEKFIWETKGKREPYTDIGRSKICVKGREPNEGACSRDSGGPVGIKSSGRVKQIGVISYGTPIPFGAICTFPIPEVVARLRYALPWIGETAGGYKKC